MLHKGHWKYRKHLPVKAWLAIALLLFNQLASALHVHDADDHARVHQCAVCMQLQPGEHAALIKCDPQLHESFEDAFHSTASSTFITAARPIPRSRAPPVVFG